MLKFFARIISKENDLNDHFTVKIFFSFLSHCLTHLSTSRRLKKFAATYIIFDGVRMGDVVEIFNIFY